MLKPIDNFGLGCPYATRNFANNLIKLVPRKLIMTRDFNKLQILTDEK